MDVCFAPGRGVKREEVDAWTGVESRLGGVRHEEVGVEWSLGRAACFVRLWPRGRHRV